MAPCFGQETHKASYSTFYLYNHHIYLCGMQTKSHCATAPPEELQLVSDLYKMIESKSKVTHLLYIKQSLFYAILSCCLLTIHYIFNIMLLYDIFSCVSRGS